MSTPGFTADASLNRTSYKYRSSAASLTPNVPAGSPIVGSFFNGPVPFGHCNPPYQYGCGTSYCGYPGCCCRRLWIPFLPHY